MSELYKSPLILLLLLIINDSNAQTQKGTEIQIVANIFIN